jgi:hypothetical protein
MSNNVVELRNVSFKHTIFGTRLQQLLAEPMTGDARQRFSRIYCEILRLAFESVGKWMQVFDVEETGPGEREIQSYYIPNQAAIDILNEANAWGCKWAEKGLALIEKTKPKRIPKKPLRNR